MKKNRLIGLLCAIAMSLTLVLPVSAAGIMNGDLSPDEGAMPYVETPESIALKKAKKVAMLRAGLLRADPDNVYDTLDVPVFQQENGHFCGPATVKQVIHYLTGASDSQEDYKEALGTTSAGTTMPTIETVLNANVGEIWTYTYGSIGTRGNWSTVIINNTSQNIPVVLDIDTRNVSAFPYRSSGHFVNTSGVDFRKLPTGITQKIRITDPFGPGLGNRWYNDIDLYNANNEHWRQAFIY